MASDSSPTTPERVDHGTMTSATAQPILIKQQPSLFRWLATVVLTAVLGVAALVGFGLVGNYHSYYGEGDKPREKFHSLTPHATKKIAIINVSGAVLEGDGFVKRQIDRVKEDNDVVGVVLRIDSPGGTVTGSDYLYHHLRQLADDRKLPIVVSMGSICASGGYYIAMAAGSQQDAIYAEPTTWTGSIGVIIPHYDLSGMLGRLYIQDDSIASGPLKQMGSLTRPMTDAERKLLQQLVDETFAGFKTIVTNGRPKFKDDPKALDAVATGQIFTANQALERGLVDKIGFIEDAISRAAELAGYTKDQLRCVQYAKPQTFFSELVDSRAATENSYPFDPAALLDLATPRAYYLWTGLPTILSNTRPQ